MSESKVVVVTGVSRGLGLSLITTLLASGWSVAALSRTSSPGLEALRLREPTRLFWRAVDLADSAAVSTFISAAQEHFGRIDALVNNAAVAPHGLLALSTDAEIEQMLAVNLAGTMAITRGCVRMMLLRRDGGAIVNVSSIAGLRGMRGLSAYAASKAALDGFTRSLARELGARNIRVNSVAPGFLDTEMSASLGPAELERVVRRTPLGRLAEIDEVVAVIGFLLSSRASFVTGQIIAVDGGWSC